MIEHQTLKEKIFNTDQTKNLKNSRVNSIKQKSENKNQRFIESIKSIYCTVLDSSFKNCRFKKHAV